MCNLVNHKLYLLSRIRKYLTTEACIAIFKTMALSVIEYDDIIYSGTSLRNLDEINKLFYRGLRICTGTEIAHKKNLQRECRISSLTKRRDLHLLLFMHKQNKNGNLLKNSDIATRLHSAPVFWQYKPDIEKVRQNPLYRGANLWNGLPANIRNMNFNDFKNRIRNEMFT